MSNIVAASLIVGSLMPFVVTFIKQSGFSKATNLIITILTCGIAGTLTVWATGGFDNFVLANLLGVIAAVFVASQAVYAAFWGNTTIEPVLNKKTSFVK